MMTVFLEGNEMTLNFRQEDKVSIYTINNPSIMNALDSSSLSELHDYLIAFNNDPDLWIGIITGSGEQAFCSGFDITELSDSCPSAKHPDREANFLHGTEVTKPLIAAVNGAALGGGLELLLLCDLRIASEKAVFGFPEVRLGLIPSWGGTQRLPHQVTWCQAAEMLFTGNKIDAQTALSIGLINRIVPQDQVLQSAIAMAETICRSAPLAVRAAKEAMSKGLQVSPEEGLQIEDALSVYLKTTVDYREGIQAFREKRQPRFIGR
jgi:enoyl-CoA hydratase/carnithine racemase